MAATVQNLLIEDFKNLFADFTIAVDRKRYKKLEYKTWKSIHQHCNLEYVGSNYVYIKEPNAEGKIRCTFPDNTWYEFPCNDDSFGFFLYLRYFANKIDNNKKIKITNEAIGIIPITSSTGFVTNPVDNLTNRLENVEKIVFDTSTSSQVYYNNKQYTDNTIKEKENKNMKFNFDFGPVNGDTVRMSPYGMAIKNANGTFVAYDHNDGAIMDVDTFNFDGSKFMYKIPVALKDVTVGDVIIHNHKPMFVFSIPNEGNLSVVDIYEGENKSIIPTTNMFGFNFVTKVVSLINVGTPNKDNPFGNMLPFLMMGDKDADMKDVAIAMMMSNGNINMMQNPLMMMMMLDKDKDSDMLPIVMAMSMMNQPVTNEVKISVDNKDNQ